MHRAIVHIGLPKTGSTSFQRALHARSGNLRAAGVRVLTYDGPDDQLAPPTRAFDLANCVVRPDLDGWWRSYLPESVLPAFVERGRDSIRRQAAEPEPLLVASNEDLFLLRTEAEVERLVDLLAPREVHVVLVRRERDAWLRSLRGQLTDAGIRTVTTWPDSCSNLAPDSWIADVDGLVALLESTLGPERVRVVDHDAALRDHGSVLPALWAACDLPAELLDADGDVGGSPITWSNRSPAWFGAADAPAGVDEREWLRDRVVAQERELTRLRRVPWHRRLASRLRRGLIT